MTAGELKHGLAAILCADEVAYSCLMAESEFAAHPHGSRLLGRCKRPD